MKLNGDIGATHHTLNRQFYSLRCKMSSVHDYSERNFNHLSKRLKVYFEEIREIATDADLLLDAMGGIDPTDRSLHAAASGIEDRRNQIHLLFQTFQVIQHQCWRLKKEVEAERTAFRTLTEKVGMHAFAANGSTSSYTEIVGFLEEQGDGLDCLIIALDNLLVPILQSGDALFFINKYFDFSEDSLNRAQDLSSSTASALMLTIGTDAALCLEDINKLATNIQIHDRVRQRLEHIDEVYEQLLHELASSKGNGLIPQYLAMIPELTRLHIAQLESTKEECMGAFSAIRSVLNTIDKRMGEALESFVKVSCLKWHFDADFNRKVEGLMQQELPSMASNEQNYIRTVGDLQASFRGLKVGLLRMRGSIVEYMNTSASGMAEEFDHVSFFDELEDLVAASRSQLLTLSVEVSNSIKQYADVSAAMHFVDEAYGRSHEVCYNESVYQLYAKKCGSKLDNASSILLPEEDNTREVHDKYTDFFSKKISEVIDDLAKLSELPRLFGASDEQILQGLAEIEKGYTMQSEREIHRKIYLGVAGNGSGAYGGTMAECAVGEDNLELF
ncbi:hypothetical protein [uncultured Acetobacteroides sp.]|uniref:hypothetical protein n=1 Tax=uncultured Acetobacteroides sp. TaxID=1760811 RepID=UPI0029F57394|nr:hypothetical protein [uncultured Acetobacteroides sp.]